MLRISFINTRRRHHTFPFNIVILRRGNRDFEGCNHALCPDVRIYRRFSALWVVILRISSAVNKGRLPQNCIERFGYQAGLQMQFFAMTVFISRVLKIIPALRLGSAGSEFITKLYVVAILKLLAVWESGVY